MFTYKDGKWVRARLLSKNDVLIGDDYIPGRGNLLVSMDKHYMSLLDVAGENKCYQLVSNQVWTSECQPRQSSSYWTTLPTAGQIEFRTADSSCFVAKEYDDLNFFTYNYMTYANGYTVFVDVKYSDVTDVWKGIIADVQNDFRIEATNSGFGCYSQHSPIDDTRFLSFPYDRNQRVKLVMKVEPLDGNTKISMFTSYGATGSFLLAGDKISQANFYVHRKNSTPTQGISHGRFYAIRIWNKHLSAEHCWRICGVPAGARSIVKNTWTENSIYPEGV